MKHKKRSWFRLILFLLLLGGLYLLMRSYEQHFIYSPSATLIKTPRDADLPFDNIILTTSDGVNIHGWFIPQYSSEETNVETHAAESPALLFFHGSDGNISDRLEKIHLLHDIGFDVFTIDYRGYGKSGGTPSERGLANDALAAYSYLVEKRDVKPTRLYVYGEGLGAAVAIDLARKVRAAGLITEAASASVLEDIQQTWPLIPWQFLLRNKFDSINKIAGVHIPVLLIHSADDDVVSFNDSRRLFALAHEPKELVEIHGSHNDAFVNSFDAYYDAISHFVHGQPKDKPVATSSSTPDVANVDPVKTPQSE